MLGHFGHELLEDDFCLRVAVAYLGVILGGDSLLQRLEAVEEAVGEVDVGPLVVGGGDELVEVVVHEGGLEAEVLVDVVGGVLAEQVLQRQQVEGVAAQAVGVRREAGADVRHEDAVLEEGARPRLRVVDLLVEDLGHGQGELCEPPAVVGRLAVVGGAGGVRLAEQDGGCSSEAEVEGG